MSDNKARAYAKFAKIFNLVLQILAIAIIIYLMNPASRS
jgi:hypothetical protein